LQPHDLYFDSSITWGKIFQVDCHPPGIQFGIHYCQIKEITYIC